jgi:hypothetical protein
VLPVGLITTGAEWRVETRPRASDPTLTGTVTDPCRRLQNQHGTETTLVQLWVREELGDYQGYSGSPVTSSPEGAAPSHVFGVLVEQGRWRISPQLGQAAPVANVLFAAPIDRVLTEFGLTGVTSNEPAGQIPLPAPFEVRRAQQLDLLIDALITNLAQPPSDRKLVGLTGMGGSGKTVLAAAAARDPRMCGLLVTTRDAANIPDTPGITLDELPRDAALQLLARWTATRARHLPIQATLVARECGYLPLALALCGAMVAAGSHSWAQLLDLLHRTDLEAFRSRHVDYPHQSLAIALGASIECLAPDTRDRYLRLAVFDAEGSVPQAALQVLWRLDRHDTAALIEELAGKSLLRVEADRVSLHDLQMDYLIRCADASVAALHDELLAGHAYGSGSSECGHKRCQSKTRPCVVGDLDPRIRGDARAKLSQDAVGSLEVRMSIPNDAYSSKRITPAIRMWVTCISEFGVPMGPRSSGLIGEVPLEGQVPACVGGW